MPKTMKMTPKLMPIEWLNETTLLVNTPGGWSQGD
jgi:hypothetical protein